MLKRNKHTIRIAAIVLFMIGFAVFLRNIQRFIHVTEYMDFITGLLRGFIYIIVFSLWSVSLRRRIVQIQARHYLIAISLLMVFWIVIRTLKFRLFTGSHVGRYLWYLYYLPLIFIPMLALFIASSLGKAEKFRNPKQVNILFIVSTLLLILVLTNDYHQLVFGFPCGLLNYDNGEYTHRLIYYVIMGWIALCSAMAFVFIVMKCRVPYSKKKVILPCIPLALLILYAILYLKTPALIHPIAGDMSVTICLMNGLIFEICIQCGLIQSNKHYNELFEITSMRMKISDEDYNILYSSVESGTISKEMIRKTETAPVMMDNGLRLCSAPIKKGHVVWLEDVSQITEIIARLADNSEYLSMRRSVLHKEVETRKREQSLSEQNRLYNRLMNDNAEEFRLYSDLICQLAATKDSKEERMLTAKIAVVCTHIKRRGNLLFLSEKGENIDGSELRFALEEWISNLRLCEVKCNLFFNMNATFRFTQLVALYDTLQWALLYTLDTLHNLLITVSEKNGEPYLILNISCSRDLSHASHPYAYITDEDEGEWIIKICISQGGERA